MAGLWIVHRDARWRVALARLAGGRETLAADPADPAAFEGAPDPRAVVLGAAGDFEAELEFAHRFGPRLAAAAWVIAAAPGEASEVRRLFDALPPGAFAVATDPDALRRRVREALARRASAPLSARRRRAALVERFARWLGDLDLPGLLAAIDPARRELPLLVRGEPGTGRGLVARYVHWMSAGAEPGPFAAVTAWPEADLAGLAARLVPETGGLASPGLLTVCVEEVDRLAPAVQDQLRGWVEHGPPTGLLPAARLRWVATAGDEVDDRLHLGLARALAGIELSIPPLRGRPQAVTRLAAAMAREAGAPGPAPDALEALCAHPWPGNLRELEATLRRSLAAVRAEPLRASDLRFETPWLEAVPEAELEAVAEAEPAPEGEAAQVGPAPAARAAKPPAPPARDPVVRRLASAVAHEIANPLVGIRTFAQMLPGRFDDPEFRAQFATRVESDSRRIEAAVDTLARIGALGAPERRPVDLCALLARLLQRERPRIQERRLVVLEELDRAHPEVLGDLEQLRFAFGLLLEEAIGWVPENGDLYVATRYEPAPAGAPHEAARVRVLLRFRGGPGAEAARLGPAEHALSVAAVEVVVRAHGGSFALEAVEPRETLILIELPAHPAGPRQG
jgi:signal transduction histidine kinase